VNPNLRPFELTIGTLVTPALGNAHANFGFSMIFFVFKLKAFHLAEVGKSSTSLLGWG